MWKNSNKSTNRVEERKMFEGENLGKRKFVKTCQTTREEDDNMKIMRTRKPCKEF